MSAHSNSRAADSSRSPRSSAAGSRSAAASDRTRAGAAAAAARSRRTPGSRSHPTARSRSICPRNEMGQDVHTSLDDAARRGARASIRARSRSCRRPSIPPTRTSCSARRSPAAAPASATPGSRCAGPARRRARCSSPRPPRSGRCRPRECRAEDGRVLHGTKQLALRRARDGRGARSRCPRDVALKPRERVPRDRQAAAAPRRRRQGARPHARTASTCAQPGMLYAALAAVPRARRQGRLLRRRGRAEARRACARSSTSARASPSSRITTGRRSRRSPTSTIQWDEGPARDARHRGDRRRARAARRRARRRRAPGGRCGGGAREGGRRRSKRATARRCSRTMTLEPQNCLAARRPRTASTSGRARSIPQGAQAIAAEAAGVAPERGAHPRPARSAAASAAGSTYDFVGAGGRDRARRCRARR